MKVPVLIDVVIVAGNKQSCYGFKKGAKYQKELRCRLLNLDDMRCGAIQSFHKLVYSHELHTIVPHRLCPVRIYLDRLKKIDTITPAESELNEMDYEQRRQIIAVRCRQD
jgi:hypothetical protein